METQAQFEARMTLQRQRALDNANRIRSRRKLMKEQLKAHERSPEDLLTHPTPDFLGTAKVQDALTWLPKVGRERAKVIVRETKTSPTLPLANLTQRQKNELLWRVGLIGLPPRQQKHAIRQHASIR